MSYPLVDTGFTLWASDLDTQLKRFHGVTSKELGVERRSLMDSYYGGQSLFAVIDNLVRRYALGVAD